MQDKNSNIRYTIESNGYIQAEDWQGSGQPQLTKVGATKWRVIVSDPSRYEGCEIHEFDTQEQAKLYIANQN